MGKVIETKGRTEVPRAAGREKEELMLKGYTFRDGKVLEIEAVVV